MKPTSPIQSFQQATKIKRFFTFTLSFILISHIFFTPAFAKGVEVVKQKNSLYVKNASIRLSKNLNEIDILLKSKNIDKDNLKTLLDYINKDEKLVLKEFESEKQKLIFSNISNTILSRHEKVVKHFKANMQKTKEKANEVLQEKGVFKSISSFFNSNSINEKDIIKNVNSLKFTESSQPHEDKLPTQVIQPNPNNKPKLKKQDFTLSGLHSTPLVKYASLSKLDYSYLADASNPAYLSQSDEVVIDESIKTKAKELNYNAIKIYNFVKNNIIFTPTWGSSKNAPLTLSSKSGNSYDISSLLIALLRASDIPARYAHGTIRVEADKFKNWIGGFSDIKAATSYASSGGIPLQAGISEGKITEVIIEHIWVEAATDFYPSRGAKNYNADSWISLDASFKQYNFKKPKDLLKIANIDINNTINSIITNSNINEPQNFISDIDTSTLQKDISKAKSNIQNYIKSLSNPNLTDIIGGKQIIKRDLNFLPSSLPNDIIVTGARYDKIPKSLQQSLTITLNPTSKDSTIDELISGISSTKQISLPYSKINSQKLTLSFKPSSKTDEEIIKSYLPDSNTTDISQLPNSLPAYLIKVTPELKLNGETLLSLKSMNLGEQIHISMTPYIPSLNQLCKREHTTKAGSFLSINTIAGVMSPKILTDLKQKIQNTQEKLKQLQNEKDNNINKNNEPNKEKENQENINEPNKQNSINETDNQNKEDINNQNNNEPNKQNLNKDNKLNTTTINNNNKPTITKQDLIGDMMYAGSLIYFASLQSRANLMNLSSNTAYSLLTSNGVFGYEPKVNYMFGIPKTISNGGIVLDLPINIIIKNKDNNKHRTINSTINIGTLSSSLEHEVPEMMFNEVKPNKLKSNNALISNNQNNINNLMNLNHQNYTQAVSAVKLIQIANQQHQKIYKITKDNIDNILPNLNIKKQTKQEIQKYISENRYVITHEKSITLNGWNGDGYIAIDPNTGSGAYEISGGMNGGFLEWQESLGIIFFTYLVEDWYKNEKVWWFTSKLGGSVMSGLGFLSDMLDLTSYYDGTARCLRGIISTITVTIILSLLPFVFGSIFGPLGALVINVISIGIHEHNKNYLNTICEKKK